MSPQPSQVPPHLMVELALSFASGLDGCIAIAHANSRADLRWARTTLTTNGQTQQTDLTVIGFRHAGDGVASATVNMSQPDSDGIRALVDSLADALTEAPSSPDAATLIELTDAATSSVAWDASPPFTDSEVFGALTPDLGEVFRRAVGDDIELFGYAEHTLATTWLGTSTGIRLRDTQPAGRFEMTAKSHSRSRSTWWGCASDDFRDIDLVRADSAVRRALDWQATRIDTTPGRHPAILSPSALGDLMVDLWWSATARDAVEGRSVFSRSGGTTRLGDSLSTIPIQLSSDPHDADMPTRAFALALQSSDASSVFDSGAPLDRVDWIRDGRLDALMATRRFSSDHSLPFVASPDSLRLMVSGATGDVDDLVSRCDDGLLVTCLWYNRLVDPQTLLLTGLTRDGVYVVRGGEVIGATTNFRFNESPVALLGRIRDAGSTHRTLPREMGDYAPRVAMPPVTVDDFNFSTVSEAL